MYSYLFRYCLRWLELLLQCLTLDSRDYLGCSWETMQLKHGIKKIHFDSMAFKRKNVTSHAKTFLTISVRMAERTASEQIRNG